MTVVRYDLAVRIAEVKSVRDITPSMRRITLGGADLAGLRCEAPCDHVKLFFPAEGRSDPIVPTVDGDGRLVRPASGHKPLFRDLTTRHHRPDSLELNIDFFLHANGVASGWATTATIGDRLGIAGPRGSKHVRRDFDWYLLGGDETALPALARWLESFGDDDRAIVVAEVASPADRSYLPIRDNVEVHWLYRGDAAPGSTTLLADALRRIELPQGRFYTWMAGEVGVVRPVRRYVRDELGVDTELVNVEGYWKRGVENLDHHAPDPEDR